jgi:hypothetical protein
MRYLTQGSQSPERFTVLLSMTAIKSEDITEALRDYLVKGWAESTAAAFNRVTQSNLKRALAKMEKVAQAVETIKEIDIKNSSYLQHTLSKVSSLKSSKR